MAANPIEYAEQVLGVNTVWDEAQSRLAQHDKARREATHVRGVLRNLHEEMAQREQDVLAGGRATYHELSATAFEKVAKELLQNDPQLQLIRKDERRLQSTLDGHDADAKHHALGMQVLAARMTSLGGLFTFYAVAKQQQLVHTTTEQHKE